MNLADPVTQLNFIGEKYQRKLKNLNIETIEDLLRHYPTRYKDYSQTKKIANLVGGEKATIRAEILEIKNIFTQNRKKLTKALVRDNSGTLLLVWFNQHYLANTIKEGAWFYFSGTLKQFSGQPALLSPEYESIAQQENTPIAQKETATERTIHTARLVPIYPETSGVSSKWLRSRISAALKYFRNQDINEPLPEKVRDEYNLLAFKEALHTIHFPKDQEEAKKARKRFAFEEMFFFQLNVLKRQKEWENQKPAVSIIPSAINNLTESLPFDLTLAQKSCVKEILADLVKETPMNRLLQGDVGSGKTIVAIIAAYVTALSNNQTAYMAPTEILAQQVFRTFAKRLEFFDIKISLQTGSQKEKNSTEKADIIIGTHALLHRANLFKDLALIIIDEQHRFGVTQRNKLAIMGENHTATPHQLTMTATPIPRSLALTVFGHLDISTIDEMPAGIIPTKTWLVPEQKRSAGYRWIKNQLSTQIRSRKAEGGALNTNSTNQAFIICPLIEESEHETLEDVKAVTTEFKRLKKIFSEFKIGLLHGKIKSTEKDRILQKFRDGEIKILVSTPVVEVGIDIPQANIMVIESSHRFGLASLHQLRGRVGRAGQKSYCLLFTTKQSRKARKRLKALEKYNSGLNLAEIDLKMRGPGELYGTKQHGIPEFKLASLSNIDLIKTTRSAARKTLENINNYPQIKNKLETSKIAPN